MVCYVQQQTEMETAHKAVIGYHKTIRINFMPTFSVIVPIYNAEKTLRKCLDSMLAQSYQSFEILMIAPMLFAGNTQRGTLA